MRLVLRPVEDAGQTVCRIEREDGRQTGSGLFVSPRWADRYAADHGWPRPMRTELYKPTLGDRPIVDGPRRRLVDQSSLIGEVAED